MNTCMQLYLYEYFQEMRINEVTTGMISQDLTDRNFFYRFYNDWHEENILYEIEI